MKEQFQPLVSRENFEEYLEIQESGVTNMFDIKFIERYSDGRLDRQTCMHIMQFYTEYKEHYKNHLSSKEYSLSVFNRR